MKNANKRIIGELGTFVPYVSWKCHRVLELVCTAVLFSPMISSNMTRKLKTSDFIEKSPCDMHSRGIYPLYFNI